MALHAEPHRHPRARVVARTQPITRREGCTPEMIPETRDEAQIALLDDAIQGKVETSLYALRNNIGLEHVRHRRGVAVPILFATG